MRPLAGLLTLVMALALLPASAGAVFADEHVRDTATACPGEPEADFNDIEDSVHAANIRCMADYEIAQGRDDGSYRPFVQVRRDQMASFIVRTVETYSDQELPRGEEGRFDDVDADNVHVEAIDKLAEAEIALGRTADEFAPDSGVTRGQMALFIARAISFLDDGDARNASEPPAQDDAAFDDVGSGGEQDEAINALAGQGIVAGYGDGTYRPGSVVQRDQMASFIMRGYDYALAEELGAPDVRPAEEYDVTLSWENEVDDSDSEPRYLQGQHGAEGRALLEVDAGQDCVTFEVHYDEVDGPFGDAPGLHIHRGGIDENGPVVVALADGGDLDEHADEGVIHGEVCAEDDGHDADLNEILLDPERYYVNLHSDDFPEGAIRGQLPHGGQDDLPQVPTADMDAPQLVGFTIDDVNDDAVTASYHFDQSVDGDIPATEGAPAHFRLYSEAAELLEAGEVEVDDDRVVAVFDFDEVDFALSRVTTATVAADAVEGRSDTGNPEGSRPVQSTLRTVAATTAPDLVEVTNFGDDAPFVGVLLPADNTTVDFVFDQSVDAMADDFHLVLTDGTDVACTVDDRTQDIVHVACPVSQTDDEPVTAADVARAYVLADAVRPMGDAESPRNVRQAVGVSGSSDLPDLVDVALDEDNDLVAFTFDEEVRLGSDGTPDTLVAADDDEDVLERFAIYTRSAVEHHPVSLFIPGGDRTVVIAQFQDDVATAVGASVGNGAVVERFENRRDNRVDEVRLAETGDVRVPARVTAAPDLVRVGALEVAGDTAEVTFGFNEAVTACDDAEAFRLYAADGQRQVADSVSCDGSRDVEVTFAVGDDEPDDAVLFAVAGGAATGADGASPEGAVIR